MPWPLSRIVSRYTPIEEERAFLCGLMHDVGIAGILLTLGDAGRGKQPPDLAVLWPAIDGAHARTGARMVALWDLPADIALAVSAHHQVAIDGFDHPLAATVCLAEALAVEMRLAFVPPGDAPAEADESGLATHGRVDRSDEKVVERAREALGICEQTLGLIRQAAAEWQAAQAEVTPAGASA